MTTPATRVSGLSITMAADWMRARLRVDAIQRDTILALAAAWHEDEGGVMDVLDRLAEAQAGDPSPEELDARVEAVEDAARMDAAQVSLDLATALRLRDELDAVISRLGRFNPAVATSRGGAAA